MKTSVQESAIEIALVTGGILLIPLIGTMIGDEWDWGVFDFVVLGALIAGAGTLIELVRHNVKDTTYRALLILGVIFFGMWIWAELAVGIFTNWGS